MKRLLPRRSTLAAIAAVALFAPLTASAHGPTRQKVVETIEIQAAPAKVWGIIGNFDALSAWHPAVAKSAASNANAEGSVRELELRGGGKLTETLEGHDAAAMKMNYRAKDGGALPVTNYTSVLQVKDAGGGKSLVEWRGAFYRAFPNNNPPPDQNDEAAVKAVTEVYKAGLANLKSMAER